MEIWSSGLLFWSKSFANLIPETGTIYYYYRSDSRLYCTSISDSFILSPFFWWNLFNFLHENSFVQDCFLKKKLWFDFTCLAIILHTCSKEFLILWFDYWFRLKYSLFIYQLIVWFVWFLLNILITIYVFVL